MKSTPAFTEIKGEFPLTLYGHGAFQEKTEIKWIDIFI